MNGAAVLFSEPTNRLNSSRAHTVGLRRYGHPAPWSDPSTGPGAGLPLNDRNTLD
jgi:hypothetical protein